MPLWNDQANQELGYCLKGCVQWVHGLTFQCTWNHPIDFGFTRACKDQPIPYTSDWLCQVVSCFPLPVGKVTSNTQMSTVRCLAWFEVNSGWSKSSFMLVNIQIMCPMWVGYVPCVFCYLYIYNFCWLWSIYICSIYIYIFIIHIISYHIIYIYIISYYIILHHIML